MPTKKSDNSIKFDSSKIISKVFSYVSRYKIVVIFYMIMSIIQSLISLEFANLINLSIDSAINSSKNKLYDNIILAVIIVIVGIFITYFATLLYGIFKSNIMKDIRNDAVGYIQKLPLSFIENNHTGDLISRFTGDLASVQNFIGDELFKTVVSFMSLIITSIYLISINWKLYIISVIIMPPILFLSTKITKPMSKFFEGSSREIGKANSLAQDSYSGIFVIKAFNLENIVQDKFSNLINNSLEYQVKGIHKLKWLPIFNIILWSSPFTICLIYGSYLSINKEISPGQLPAFVYLLNNIVWPFAAIPRIISNYQMSMGKAGRLFEILEKPQERVDGSDFEIYSADTTLQFKNVSFSYNEANTKNVINNLNFSLRKGTKTALVGTSGCGKSTVLKLISGFYDYNDGTIELFGHNLKAWSLDAIRAKISFVSQDTYLFPASIFDNIQSGRSQSTKDEVIAAAKAANAHEFIMELSDGYDTLVGERGIKLSGGQRQRLSLARAFLKDAPIILLDEPTSALDTISETLVQNAMSKLMENKTALIVTHRLSTIKDVNEILVMDNGEIIEKGTHEKLISSNSHYFRLYTNQIVTDTSAI